MYYLSSTFHTDTASSSFSHLCSGKVKSHRINPEEKDKVKIATIKDREMVVIWSGAFNSYLTNPQLCQSCYLYKKYSIKYVWFST